MFQFLKENPGVVIFVIIAVMIVERIYRENILKKPNRETEASLADDVDGDVNFYSHSGGVNPASGLPMTGYGLDVAGNPYGRDRRSDHDD